MDTLLQRQNFQGLAGYALTLEHQVHGRLGRPLSEGCVHLTGCGLRVAGPRPPDAEYRRPTCLAMLKFSLLSKSRVFSCGRDRINLSRICSSSGYPDHYLLPIFLRCRYARVLAPRGQAPDSSGSQCVSLQPAFRRALRLSCCFGRVDGFLVIALDQLVSPSGSVKASLYH